MLSSHMHGEAAIVLGDQIWVMSGVASEHLKEIDHQCFQKKSYTISNLVVTEIYKNGMWTAGPISPMTDCYDQRLVAFNYFEVWVSQLSVSTTSSNIEMALYIVHAN